MGPQADYRSRCPAIALDAKYGSNRLGILLNRELRLDLQVVDVDNPADYFVPQYSPLLDCLLFGVVDEQVVAKHENLRIITGCGEDGFIGLALRHDNVDSLNIRKPGLYVFTT